MMPGRFLAPSATPSTPAVVAIRRVQPGDEQALLEFYAALSPDSRRARFLGSCSGLSDSQALSFCTPDHQHAEGFVALEGPQMVGHLCLEPYAEDGLELAVAVPDERQGRGIGRALFETALRWAENHAIARITATAYADNVRVLRLLSSAPHPPTIRGPQAGVVSVTIPLHGPVPQPWRKVIPPGIGSRRRPAGRPTGRCRVVWRRRRPPVRGAAG